VPGGTEKNHGNITHNSWCPGVLKDPRRYPRWDIVIIGLHVWTPIQRISIKLNPGYPLDRIRGVPQDTMMERKIPIGNRSLILR
jgi:hypothetical protein